MSKSTELTTIPEKISMEVMVERAGSNLSAPLVVFERNVYDGTLGHARNPIDAIEGFKEAIMSEYEVVQRTQAYEGYTPDEVRAAVAAIGARFTTGVPQPISNDPTIKPSTKIVEVGYDWQTGKMQTIVVPAGEMSLPGFVSTNPKKWQPSMQVTVGARGVPHLIANVLRRDQDAVEGVFKLVRDWANLHSIYLGQVMDVGFGFMKLTDFKPQNVALTDTLRSKIELFVTGPMLYPDALDNRGLPRKTGIFLEGPPGGGKTIAMTTCAYLFARNGGAVIVVDPAAGVDGLDAANRRTQVLLENGHQVMICMEDMEKHAEQNRAKVLDILDGTNSKGVRRCIIGTTNFLEQIDRAMIRPGRFDAVEHCGLPDLSAFEQLVKVLIEEKDRGDIDFAAAFPYFEGYSYAFIANAVQTIIRAAINTAKGDLDALKVGTQDLIDAANSVRGHHALMQEEVVKARPDLDTVFQGMVNEAVTAGLEDFELPDSINYDYVRSMIHDETDSVVEGRLHKAQLLKDNGAAVGTIHTN